MQAKLLILFVLVAAAVVSCTEGFGAAPAAKIPLGRKREVRLCIKK